MKDQNTNGRTRGGANPAPLSPPGEAGHIDDRPKTSVSRSYARIIRQNSRDAALEFLKGDGQGDLRANADALTWDATEEAPEDFLDLLDALSGKFPYEKIKVEEFKNYILSLRGKPKEKERDLFWALKMELIVLLETIRPAPPSIHEQLADEFLLLCKKHNVEGRKHPYGEHTKNSIMKKLISKKEYKETFKTPDGAMRNLRRKKLI